MSAWLEVIEPGIANTVQDAGRPGYRSIGVPLSGAADAVLLACANALVGNGPGEAGLELSLVGPRLQAAGGAVRVALAGAVAARVVRGDGSVEALPAWRSATLAEGDVLAVGPPGEGAAYLAVAGGIGVPTCLGSRSTYLRAGLGGVHGRAIAQGDRLPCRAARGAPGREVRAGAPYAHPDGPLRVVPGPQDDHFEPEALRTFFESEYTVTRETDRMGMRLAGLRLAHRPDRGADIVSDGVVPGAVQVPADGLPIVLLADAQTVGGYAKLATIIRADLPRLAHCLPGTRLRFTAVTVEAGRAAYRAQAAALAAWIGGIGSFRLPGGIDEAALYSSNLVSGAIDADAFRRAADIDLPWEKEP